MLRGPENLEVAQNTTNFLHTSGSTSTLTAAPSTSAGAPIDEHGEEGGASSLIVEDYIFNWPSVQVSFILLYTIVFCFCFFGNLLVILVVTMHWKMRNITKFCLANLAFADLCVGVFCVYQNLSTYLSSSWIFGEALCKMYYFINSLSHTSAVLILVVICVERYLAIRHPFRCKQILNLGCLRVLIVAVWIVSAIYCSPRLYYANLVTVDGPNGRPETFCSVNRTKYSSKLFDSIHFVLLYLLPVLVMSILYALVGITLWKSGTVKVPMTARRQQSSEHLNQRFPSHLSRRSTSFTSSSDSCAGADAYRFDSQFEDSVSVASGAAGYPLQTYTYVDTPTAPPNTTAGVETAETTFTFDAPGGGGAAPPARRLRRTKRQRHPPSYMVQVGDKCYLVGEKETKVLELADMSATTMVDVSAKTGGDVNKLCNGASNGKNSFNNNNYNNMVAATNRMRSFRGGKRPVPKKLLQRKDSESWRDPLKSRKIVTRMLIIIVVSFALCNFPFHLRKLLQYWWPNYDLVHRSQFGPILTSLTYLVMYLNSALNPIIYAFMSKTFRSSVRDLISCRWKKPYHNSPSERRASATRVITVNVQASGGAVTTTTTAIPRAFDRMNSVDSME